MYLFKKRTSLKKKKLSHQWICVFIGIGLFFTVSNAYSQSKSISITAKDAPLETVLKQIESQSGYSFSYADKIDLNRKVSIDEKNRPLNEVLNLLFGNTEIVYKFKDKQIILQQKEKEKPLQTQQHGATITGTIFDEIGEGIAGATVAIKGTTRGVSTDLDGTFSIQALPADQLEISFLGYQPYFISVGKQTNLSVTLVPKANELDEVTVVAFGKQKKESVISSITTVNTRDLIVPSSNLTTAFAGRIAGMISYQTSGEPGRDDADFFIRGITTFGTGKVDPLILIDNVEVTSSDLAKMHPDDIASFSILKDATATALYGARGANGVVMVTTKEGMEGKARVNVRLENSFSQATSKIDMADPITYMEMANEAVLARNPAGRSIYTRSKIDNTIRGTNPYVYPAVDWMDMLISDMAINQRANLSISGGGTVARYYVAGSFAQDNGILNVDKRNNFNNNINYKKYMLRSNVNVNLSKFTEMIIRLSGSFDDNQGPLTGGNEMYKRILKVSPTRFPAYYEPDQIQQGVQHILFGGYGGATQDTEYYNPYADMLRGYNTASTSSMSAQLEFKQSFEKLIKGLTGRVLLNTNRNSAFDFSMAYNPFYYRVGNYDRLADEYMLMEINSEQGTDYLKYTPGGKTVNTSLYGEGSLAYNRTFNDKHAVSGMLVGIIRNYLSANAGTLIASLPARNLGLSGRFTYAYDNRYFAEVNFGYNGSEKFDKGHRWGFFPSFGAGWTVSNENFYGDNLKDILSLLKFRATYGLVGNDQISDTRFFYLSEVDPNGGGSYQTGSNWGGLNLKGYKISNYANPDVGWEIAYKTNLGLELGLLKDKIQIQADLFREHRINILQPRADIPISMGLWATPQVNVGEANGEGIDVSLDYKQSMNKDLWFVGRANFTYAHSTFAYYEEPDYALLGAPWKSKIGRGVKQQEGYVAEHLFIDQYEVDNSPRQDFGEYGPGDIKYKDINKDGVINELDQVPIGYPETPEINYGFGLSVGYKKIDASLFFSGSSRSSFWIDSKAMSPFVVTQVSGGISDKMIMENGLAKFIANDYWSELSQNPQAKWPRLADRVIDNNIQRSTWFMYDNNFLRLKSVELGYSMPDKFLQKTRLSSCRLYLSGTNLLLFSKFKIWDVELGGNGLNYPLQRVFNIGINLSY